MTCKIYKNIRLTISQPDFPMVAIGVDSTQFGIALIWVSFIISWK
nr:MAG TPA: hypothetical protein [Caudoviricetes sp.]